MIVVHVQLWPGGDQSKAKHLGTATITNDGTGDPANRRRGKESTLGNYRVRLSKRGQPTVRWRDGRVEGFRRKRYGAWDLLYLALRACLGGRRIEEIER